MKKPERAIMTRIVSELAVTHALLNCLIKEFALPEQCVWYEWPEQTQGLQPTSCLSGLHRQAEPLLIRLPGERELFVLADRRDSFGSQRYLSDVYIRTGAQAWTSPDFATLAQHLLEGCGALAGHFNEELFAQVLQSQQVVGAILQHLAENNGAIAGEQDAALNHYRASEQSLWFGHPCHPAPKARQWPQAMPHSRFSPEFQITTPLHQFEVPAAGLQVQTNGIGQGEALQGLARQEGLGSGRHMIAMHPVQAHLFMSDARVQKLLEQGSIVDRGTTGFEASPTASIRTWYAKGHPYFIKGSLNVRITNCVRKNAWYELESAMVIDRLFQRLQQERPESFRGALVAAEPAMLSWSPEQVSEEDQRWFREQTGVILRENFCLSQGEENCLLAATLFARNERLQPMIWQLIGEQASDEQRVQWFSAYQRLLLEPVLSLFFNHGIVLEPHLQNTVLVHKEGMPERMVLRDFEGVKLTQDLGIFQLEETLHPRVHQSMVYSRQQGWSRVVYCLLVNNLSEAVLALTWDRPKLAQKLWQVVEQQLQQIRAQLDVPTTELDELLAGGVVSFKCNLRVRLAADADRKASYVRLKSPWHQEVAQHA